MLITSGKEFGGRDNPYRISAVYKDTGISFNTTPDLVWKTLRMTVQRHLKQFGEGMSKLEDIIVRVSDESMFSRFTSKINTPFAPKDIIYETALRTLIFVICGELSDEGFDQIISIMKEYMSLARTCHPVTAPMSYQILDACPWLRFLGVGPVNVIDKANIVKDRMWDVLDKTSRENPNDENILKVFRDYQESDESSRCTLVDDDLKSACVAMLLAGTVTTTDTFDSFMNILAHHQNVQEAIIDEINEVTGGSPVELVHRSQMHYTRATLLETLRYTSVSALGLGRKTTATTQLQSYTIPEGSRLAVNYWQLHHDPEFWVDPDVFRPERFLDDQGEVVPVDHKYRRHLMPFGAGLRVCVAEPLAMSRLFLWISSLVQRFEVVPAPGNNKSSASSKNLIFDGLVCSKPYEIILKNRVMY